MLLVAVAPPVALAQDRTLTAFPHALAWPLDCRLGETCWVAQYPDVDPGPGVSDFACGRRSYQDHKGVDIAIHGLPAMRTGVLVRAAAPGTVFATRDGMADVAVTAETRAAVTERGCGNAVVLDHGDGWRTVYCHMRRGSIAVAKGDRVETGAALGLVGLSGLTEFPHLHLQIQYQGRVVDPFLGETIGPGQCRPDLRLAPPTRPLWDAGLDLGYRPLSIADLGFLGRVPDAAILGAGELPDGMPLDRDTVAATAPVLMFWVQVWGLAPDDRVALRLTGPDGAELAAHATVLDRHRARHFQWIGGRRPGDAWPTGTYRGTVTVTRPGLRAADGAPWQVSRAVTARVGPRR